MEALDKPLNLTQYFVNKQNIRSFENFIKWDKLNVSELKFYEMLFDENQFLVSELSGDFLKVLSLIKVELRNNCKDDFKKYFLKNEDSYLTPVNKEFIFNNCWRALCDIIPRDFFACNHNSKIFKNFVHAIIFSMKRHHFTLGKFVKKWDILVAPWKHLPRAREILYHLMQWIFRYILAPMISLNFYVTTCKLDADENKFYYFWKSHWQSFYDKQISKMIYTKVIKKVEPYSIGKKTKHNHSIANRLKLKLLKKEIPKLHLALKLNNECRPIVCYKYNSPIISEKYRIRDRLHFLRSLTGKSTIKIEDLYKTLYNKWIMANKPKLYFIKTDLSNAFGSINREKLAMILSERYLNCLKAESCIYRKKRIVQQLKDIVTELSRPILIRAGSTVYEWKEGLVQGYKYSPALSELYYNHLDEKYFSGHINDNEGQIRLFKRVVDDYLYITDSLDDALLFLKSLTNYRNVNYEKTVVNFKHENIKFSEEIVFLGFCYNTSNMNVSRASNIYTGQTCYKIAFTSGISNMPKFIESRVGQSGIQISSHVFNFLYNSEEIIWRHIFATFCLSANKFCSILAVLHEEGEMRDFIPLYKKKVTVRLTCSILDTLMCNKPPNFLFLYCINHLRYLSWKALFLCAKLTPKCSGLVPKIQVELAKTNCIFGVWREHACRIDTNGEIQRKAIKQICRRSDLRVTFKNFEDLPSGFECYHHKRLQ